MEENPKQYAGKDKVVSSTDYYNAIKKLPEEKRIPFGLPGIDNLTEGFAMGELIVISGYTGYGKTTWCQSVTYSLAKRDIRSLWLSYELTPRQFFKKFPEPMPLFYMPKINRPYSLDWVEEKIIESKQKYGIKAVFIDHLHYVIEMKADMVNPRHLVIGDMMRNLKQMTLRNNITIFLVAHTKMPKDDVKPGLESIRDSSFVTQEADAVYVMHRERKRGSDEVEAETTFLVLKQRHTGKLRHSTKLIFHNGLLYDRITMEDEQSL